MSYQVLARKWRPRTFESLVGQEHVVRALTHALDAGRLHHAYLFTGTRGVGKTTLARILAKSLNCETGITSRPCGKCSACVEIDAGRFVDLLEVDAATNTRVEEMRQLLENAVYAPTRGRFKVYVIDEVHMLSTSAFNAMLKTLEEPPGHIKFILATTDPQKIPVTVLSRCLQFGLKQMPAAAITAHLAKVLAQEGVPAEEEALRVIARSARGSMRDALSILDQAIAHGAGSVTAQNVAAMLGVIDEGFLYSLLEAVAKGDAQGALAIADELSARSASMDGALQQLAALLHRIALAQSLPAALTEEGPARDRIAALAGLLAPEDVQLYYQIATHGRDDLPYAPDEYAGFSMALLRMFAFRMEEAAGGGDGARREAPRPPAAPAGTARAAPPAAAPGPALPHAGPAAVGAVQTAAPAAGSPSAGERPGGIAFDGDWPRLVTGLALGGIAGQLAQASELKRYDGVTFELRIPTTARHLAEKAYQDRLRSALQARFGQPVRLAVEVGETAGNSARERASASITQDAFVREMMENFDASIVESSIKPAR